MQKQFDIVTVDGFLYAVDKEQYPDHDTPGMFSHEGRWWINTFSGAVKYSVTTDKIIATNNPALTNIPQLPPVGKPNRAKEWNDNARRMGERLPFPVEQEGYDTVEQDVEQLAQAYIESEMAYQIQPEYVQKGVIRDFTAGYKAAQPKQYTEDDMRKAYNAGTNRGGMYQSLIADEDWDAVKDMDKDEFNGFNEILQSLRPVPRAVVLEMEKEWLVRNRWLKELEMYSEGWNGDVMFPHRIIPKVDSNNRVIVRRWIW